MATVIFRRNPFDLHQDVETFEVPTHITVREWLEKQFPGFVEFEKPTYCVFNGDPIARKDWNRTMGKGDIVQFLTLPGQGPWLWFWIAYAVITIATVIIVSQMRPEVPNEGEGNSPDSVYNLRGQRNQVKLGQVIECGYGLNRMWPSYAAQPYNRYIDNDQWLFQVFCIGHGKYVLDNFRIEDTPFSSFQDIEYEIVQPGQAVTLFPDNVHTNVEVSQIELRGPNEPGVGEVEVEDSPGAPGLGIPASSHNSYDVAGPYVANPALTQTELIELDVSLPRGLYLQNNSGGLDTRTVTVQFEARAIDAAGAPIGDWFVLTTWTKTLATTTPQRFTLSATVPPARYEVRGMRINDKDTDYKAANTVQWESLRAFLPSGRTFGNVTCIALKAKATNNLNDRSSTRFNVEALRILPVFNGEEWEEAPTRGIVWAFVDVFMAAYGGRLSYSNFDLDALLALDAVWTDRNEFFDGVFDNRQSCWEAARTIALVGRAVPMLNGSRLTMIRDEPKTVPVAMFNQENIVKGSWRWDVKLVNIDAHDGLEVTYMDPTTGKPLTVLCLVGDDVGDNPEKIDVSRGIRSRQHAYNLGQYLRRRKKYQNQNIVLRTGMEGHIPTYGDLVLVGYKPAKWGQGGAVKSAGAAQPYGNETITWRSRPENYLDTYALFTTTTQPNLEVGDSIQISGATPVGYNGTWEVLDVYQEDDYWVVQFNIGVSGLANATGAVVIEKVTGLLQRTLTLNEPVQFGVGDHKIALRKNDASVLGPLDCLPGETSRQVVVIHSEGEWEEFNFDGTVELPTFLFGPLSNWSRRGRVANLVPTDDDTVELTLINDDNRLYEGDGTPPPAVGGDGNVPTTPQIPTIKAVKVLPVPEVPNEVLVSWQPADGAQYYVVQLSVNGTSWETVAEPTEPLARFRVPPLFIYVRVAAFGVAGLGEWGYWTGTSPAARSSEPNDNSAEPNAVTSLTATGGFGMIALSWVNPTNTALKEILIFENTVNEKPATPKYIEHPKQTNKFVTNLPDNHTLYFWVQPRSTYGHVSAEATVSGTTVNGISLDHIINGGMTPIVPLAVLPSSGNYQGRLVYLTADDNVGGTFPKNKLYRWTSDSVTTGKDHWTAAVPAVDITGQLTNDQIADLEAAKLTGQITGTQIEDEAISTPKLLAGSITTEKIAALAITADELAANAVTAAKVAAGAITTAKLAAGAVTATELAADSVTAGKIAAAAVTATAIGTNEIIALAANIKDAVITGAKIADAAIGSAKIADAAIISAKIADLAVTTAKIEDLNVTTLKIQDQAVTIPVSAYTAGLVSLLSGGGVYDLQEASIVSTGAPVFVLISFYAGSAASALFTFEVLRGATVIHTAPTLCTPASGSGNMTVCYSFTDTPGAGPHTYKVRASGNGVGVAMRSILLLEVKK